MVSLVASRRNSVLHYPSLGETVSDRNNQLVPTWAKHAETKEKALGEIARNNDMIRRVPLKDWRSSEWTVTSCRWAYCGLCRSPEMLNNEMLLTDRLRPGIG